MATFIQPCRLTNPSVRQHFDDTLAQPVALERLQPFLASSQTAELESVVEPPGGVRLWGVVPGPTNTPQFQHVQRGDAVLLTGDNRVHHRAEVAYVFPSPMPELASDLWDQDADGRTWAHMYVMAELVPIDVGYAELRAVLGYKSSWVPQRFQVFDGQRGEHLRRLLVDAPVSEPPLAGRGQGEPSRRRTVPDIRDRIGSMRRFRRQAPHKPLLLLAALGRIESDPGCARLVPFAGYERLLAPLTPYAGSSPLRPEYPFVRTVSDGLWDVPDLASVREGTNDVSAERLRESGVQGGLPAADHERLRSDPGLRLEVIEQLLELLPEALAEVVVLQLGLLDLDAPAPPAPPAEGDPRVEPPDPQGEAPDTHRGGRAPAGLLAQAESAARELGRDGEQWVLELEQRRLREAGRHDLAERVEHVAATADGDGYDIRSFEPDGTDRYVEVKTTTKRRDFAFHFTINELEASRDLGDRYVLVRVFNYPRRPKYFEVRGPLDSHWYTQPRTFSAHPRWKPTDQVPPARS